MIQRAIFLLTAVATLSHTQTQVDLRNQSKNIDFSGAVATKPLKVGTMLPSTCQVGEMFFKSDAAPGANLYGCAAANQWILQTSGGGGTGLPPQGGNAGRLLMSDGTYALWAQMSPGSGMSKTMVGSNTTWSVDSASIPFLGLNNAFLGVNSFADRQQWTQISTPASPPSGSLAVYAKTGAGVCWKNSSGVETCAGAGGGGGVSSVFARQGDVAAQSGDYNAGQITNTPAGNISATNVQAAVNELDTEKAAVSHTHAAADITSGTLELTRGGTNNGTWTAGRCVQVSTDGTKLENASGACGTAGGGLGDPGTNGIVVRTAPNVTTARTITGTTNRISVTNGNGVSGEPTIDAGPNIVDKTQATTYSAGAKQAFQASATTAALNIPPAALPTSPAAGDFTVDSSDLNKLKWYNGTSWQAAGGGGGSSSVVSYYTFAAATCQQGAASTGFALPSSNAPAPTCVTGSNAGDVTQANSAWNFGTLSFAKNATAATAQSVQGSFVLPPYWDSSANIPVGVRWRTSATSEDVVWQIQGQCVADGEIPGSFSSPVAFAADTAKGTAGQFNDVTTKNLTTSDVLSGCAAGKTFLFRFFRDGTNASDTLATAGELISIRFQVTRTQ